ncbi:MAG TPA: hypothetical protein VJA26_18725 [Gammaproteobacteria bacterium]|nr:hypothetical protein [Gammaproteobacteria bacterium]
MKIQPAIRGLLARGLLLLAVLAGLTILINLSWFDEPLHPDLLALSTPRPVSMDDNAYPLIYGLPAAEDKDPIAAGRTIVQELRERYQQGRRIALSVEEMDAILGGSGLDVPWQGKVESLTCNSRSSLDCADRLIAQVGQADIPPRLRTLLARYETILRESRFEEIQELDVYSPVPAYGLLMSVGRMRLAISYKREPADQFLAKVAEDFDFWRTLLRDGDSLIANMVALAGLRNDLEFLSASMRLGEPSEEELELIRSVLEPLTSAERDIGEAFLSELRIALLSEKPLVVTMGEPSWVTRLTLQEHATLNEYYLATTVPLRLRATLSAEEFYGQRGYERMTYNVRAFPPPLFNLGGKLALKQTPAYQDYISRVHDLDGRIALVLLQTEIEQKSGQSVAAIVQSSKHRNPYTLAPMKYDVQTRTIGFECLSNPNDVCSVALGPLTR